MKCPWRPVTIKLQSRDLRNESVQTDFAECYGKDCPFYSPERKISANLSTAEHCKRTELEAKK